MPRGRDANARKHALVTNTFFRPAEEETTSKHLIGLKTVEEYSTKNISQPVTSKAKKPRLLTFTLDEGDEDESDEEPTEEQDSSAGAGSVLRTTASPKGGDELEADRSEEPRRQTNSAETGNRQEGPIPDEETDEPPAQALGTGGVEPGARTQA